jgi:hypothetical protein
MIAFSCYNIKFDKHPVEKWIIVRGEIKNESAKSLNTAVFRVKLLIGHLPLGSAVLKIHGFRERRTKAFEVMVEDAHRDLLPKITGCEISFESGF